ncbi:MAG: hypothetical protein ABL949_17025 [Fimbriimonadaceae bacterium]
MKGVGVFESGKVKIHALDKKVIATVPVNAMKPLWYSNAQKGVVFAPVQPLTVGTEAVSRTQLREPKVDFFGIAGHLFVRRAGVTFMGSNSTISFPQYDWLSSIGIDESGSTMAVLTVPMRAAQIVVSRRTGNDWMTESFVRCPEIEGASLLVPTPVALDMRFVAPDIVAHIGQASAIFDQSKLTRLNATIPDLSSYPLNPSSDKPELAFGYLVLTRLKDGLSIPVARVSWHMSAERQILPLGALSVSEGYGDLFLRSSRGILHFSIPSLVKEAGFDQEIALADGVQRLLRARRSNGTTKYGEG